jgi:MYXO-CTERM domain-containing protein
MLKRTALAAAMALGAMHAQAAPITLEGGNTNVNVVERLVGSSISPFNQSITSNADPGPVSGVSRFSNGDAVGISSGVVLSTGNTGCVRGFTSLLSTNCTSPTSATSATGLGSFSEVSFSFDVAQAGTLKLAYVFASEEFGNALPNNDFARFLLVRDATPDVTVLDLVTSVSGVAASADFINNPTGALDTEYDGLTAVRDIVRVLDPGSYTLTLSIFDAGADPDTNRPFLNGDSALFIREASFTSSPTDPGTVPEPSTWGLAGFGLLAALAVRRRRH